MPLRFVFNERGDRNLVERAYEYVYHQSGDRKEIWRCIRYNSGTCRGRCWTTSNRRDGNILQKFPHDHGPDARKNGTEAARSRKNEANIFGHGSSGPVTNIINQVYISSTSSNRNNQRKPVNHAPKRLQKQPPKRKQNRAYPVNPVKVKTYEEILRVAEMRRKEYNN